MVDPRANNRVAIGVVAIVVGMVGLSFAAVPLYDLFCRVTGYGGTTARAVKAPDTVLERRMEIVFDTRVDNALPWDFKPDVRRMTVKIGQQGLISFRATNDGSAQTIGTAVYNVTPAKAGKYFQKIQCFCFNEQALAPGAAAEFPVMFFVDPKITEDRAMDDVQSIVLSYTFFSAGSAALDDAISTYGMKPITGAIKRD